MSVSLPTPKDDPDKRPLLERVRNDAELAIALQEWVLPTFRLIDDPDLYARCCLLLGFAVARLTRPEGRR